MHHDHSLPIEWTVEFDCEANFPTFTWREGIRNDFGFSAFATCLRWIHLQNGVADILELECPGQRFDCGDFTEIEKIGFELNSRNAFGRCGSLGLRFSLRFSRWSSLIRGIER